MRHVVMLGMLVAVAAVLVPCASGQAITYDLSDGLFANIAPNTDGDAVPQTGVDGWWFKYDPVTPWGGWRGKPLDDPTVNRDPSSFLLMQLAYDGSPRPYGWGANLGGAIGDRGVFKKGGWDARMVQGGTTQGDAVWGNADNNVQIVAEWVAPADGLAEASFELAGRDHAETDLQWHLAKWAWDEVAAAKKLVDLGFVLVTQEDTPQSPESLIAQANLRQGDSVFLYGYVWDHDAYDGTVIRGGITFTPAGNGDGAIPEPASLGLLALGLAAVLRRRRRS